MTGIVLWGLMFLALILAFIGPKVATIFRILLLLCCLLLILIGLALFYYLWSTVVISGTCGMIREVVKENRNALDEINAS